MPVLLPLPKAFSSLNQKKTPLVLINFKLFRRFNFLKFLLAVKVFAGFFKQI
jgi:hypothetical protein